MSMRAPRRLWLKALLLASLAIGCGGDSDYFDAGRVEDASGQSDSGEAARVCVDPFDSQVIDPSLVEHIEEVRVRTNVFFGEGPFDLVVATVMGADVGTELNDVHAWVVRRSDRQVVYSSAWPQARFLTAHIGPERALIYLATNERSGVSSSVSRIEWSESSGVTESSTEALGAPALSFVRVDSAGEVLAYKRRDGVGDLNFVDWDGASEPLLRPVAMGRPGAESYSYLTVPIRGPENGWFLTWSGISGGGIGWINEDSLSHERTTPVRGISPVTFVVAHDARIFVLDQPADNPTGVLVRVVRDEASAEIGQLPGDYATRSIGVGVDGVYVAGISRDPRGTVSLGLIDSGSDSMRIATPAIHDAAQGLSIVGAPMGGGALVYVTEDGSLVLTYFCLVA